MPKFVFQFEPVLRQRQAEEDRCQQAYARVLRQRLILHTQLRSMQETIVASKGDLRDGLVGRVDMTRVGQFARYSGQATQHARQIVLKLASVEKQIEAAQAKLAEATRSRRAIELLRDKHLRRWQREQERIEAARADELNTQTFARRAMVEAQV